MAQAHIVMIIKRYYVWPLEAFSKSSQALHCMDEKNLLHNKQVFKLLSQDDWELLQCSDKKEFLASQGTALFPNS